MRISDWSSDVCSADLVHARPLNGQLAGDHPRGAALGKEGLRDLANGLRRRPLAHADENDTVADRHDVATFCSGQPVIAVRVAPPDRKARILEVRMTAIDGSYVERLKLARRDRKSVVSGKRVDVRVGLGCRRTIKNKNI